MNRSMQIQAVRPFGDVGTPMRLVGSGPVAESLGRSASDLSASGADVMLSGEPGAGKGHFAFLLHFLTFPKGDGTFVEISPATGEEELKAVLFREDLKRFEGIVGRAVPHVRERSTLFIRSIHEFPFMGQTRIARFLIQNDAARRRGDPGVRVIVAAYDESDESLPGRASNESLAAYLHSFKRLRIPPLRERREDIPLLVEHFLMLRTGPGATVPVSGTEFIHQLSLLPFPDNIRELKWIVDEAVHSSRGSVLDVPPAVIDESATVRELVVGLTRGKKVTFEDSLGALERSLVRRAMIRANGDRAKAAALLGLSDLNLRYRLKKFGIEIRPEHRG